MKYALLFSLCAAVLPAKAQTVTPIDPNSKQLFYSELALGAASAADAASSWGLREQNPLLRRGTFGIDQLVIKTVAVGISVVLQRRLLKKHPEKRTFIERLNWISAGALGGVVSWNIHEK